LSGTDYDVKLTEYGSTGVFNGTKIIDGKTYIFWVDSNPSDSVLAIVWDDDVTNPASAPATGVDAGNTTSVFSTIMAADGAEVALLENVTIGAQLNTTIVEIMGIEIPLETGTGKSITGTGITYDYNEVAGWITVEGINVPSVGILEEEGEDVSGNDVRNIVIVETTHDGDEIQIDTSGSTPIFSDATQSVLGWLSTADNDVEVSGDRYGTFVSKNTDQQGTVDLYYPDNQVIMAVGIGKDPRFGFTGGAVVDEAYQITTPIAKLANEVTTSTLDRDVILVGGPCANALVATLMGVTTANCLEAEDLKDTSGNFLNTGLIKTYEDAFDSGQKALVVAGMSGDNTRALCARALSTGTADYSN
jgi:hypothetical protein